MKLKKHGHEKGSTKAWSSSHARRAIQECHVSCLVANWDVCFVLFALYTFLPSVDYEAVRP
jgi:hypothetical protein